MAIVIVPGIIGFLVTTAARSKAVIKTDVDQVPVL